MSGKRLLFAAACVCFAIAVLEAAGILSLNLKIEWTDLGLFFGFLAYLI
jgi:hypothetical protein